MISFAGGKCTADQNYVLVLAAIVRVIRNKTRLGRNMFAAGGNTEAAAVSWYTASSPQNRRSSYMNPAKTVRVI